jgi:aminoglycoside N3'-acetyltransferase
MNLFERVSDLAVRRLRPEHISELRSRYQSTRKKFYPLMRTVYGTFGTAELSRHLEERLGREFEILMVHSSVNNMAPMFTEGPIELLRMLKEYCGPERTLVMPAFYFGDPKLGGIRETFRRNPRFDVLRTPSQMGLLTELFRRTSGVRQSRNPVYRVSALGPLAEDLVRGHEHADSPAGRGTPFDFMANRNTLILGIGKPYEVLTQVHHAEAILGEEFPVPRGQPSPLPMTLVVGAEEIPFVLKGRSYQWPRNMWKLPSIMNSGTLQYWRFHHVPMFATRARDVTESLIAAARRGVTLYERP